MSILEDLYSGLKGKEIENLLMSMSLRIQVLSRSMRAGR